MTQTSHIRGMGFYVPEKILTNADLEVMVETSDEWITTRTGIKERHIAKPGTGSSDLALPAAQKALADAGLTADDLTHIICATLTPDAFVPSAACLLQHKLGIAGKVAYDLNAACSGFTYALEAARSVVALHPEAVVLVAACEVLTSRTNWEDRATCVLFGDGCGALVVTGSETPKSLAAIKDVRLYSDGAISEYLTVLGGGSATPYTLGQAVGPEYFVQMQGREIFKHAVRNMTAVTVEVLERHGYTPEDVDLFIPHQANARIIESVAQRLKLSGERVFVNVDRYGNTSAASVPIALAEARELGRIKPGDLVVAATFGGGFTWGAALLQF